jgi:hypothetical protein
MKLIDGKEKSKEFYLIIFFVFFANLTCRPMLEHLNKRGVSTNYWVINDDDELLHVIRTSNV